MDDQQNIGRLFGEIIRRFENIVPALERIGFFFVQEMKKNISLGGRPVPWLKSRRAELTGGQTLRNTGRLMNSIAYAIGLDRKSIEVGSNVIYGRIHAEGGVITAKNAEFLMFRVPMGLRTTAKSGKPLKRAQLTMGWVRVKSVTIPKRDWTYIPPEAYDRAAAIAGEFVVKGIIA